MRLPTLLAVACALAPLAAATLTDPIQDDARSGGDAGDGPADATPLRNPKERDTADGEYAGRTVMADDPADWFSFEVRNAGPLVVELRATGAGCALPALPVDLTPVSLVLLSPDGAQLRRDGASPCGFRASLEAFATEGTWLVGVEHGAPRSADGAAPGPASPRAPLSSPPSPEMDYDLLVGCKPVC